MFKNMKRLATLSLPLVALSLTSCNNGPKYTTYDKMRRFAVETYDQHALDAVPTTVTTNFNKAQANIVIDYKTPDGGSNSLTFSFGFSGVHVVVKNQYAYCLSSTMIDMIEQYYSDFAGIAVSLQKEPPLQMNYALTGNNCSKIELTAKEQLVGSVLVKLLQLGTSVVDIASKLAGYIPTNTQPSQQITKYIVMGIQGLLTLLFPIPEGASESEVREIQNKIRRITNVIIGVMNYLELSVSDSSRADGEVFDSYLTTDSFGFINKLVFDFTSNFVITGLARFKTYESSTPREGDKPIATEAPYQFTMTGSIDFDIDVVSQY